MANKYFLNIEVPYRTPDLGLVRYVDAIESTRLLEKVQAEVCGTTRIGLHW